MSPMVPEYVGNHRRPFGCPYPFILMNLQPGESVYKGQRIEFTGRRRPERRPHETS